MAKKDYWAERMAAAQTKLTNKSIYEVDKQLNKYYSNTMRKVISDFENTYDKIQWQIAQGKAPTPALLYQLDNYWQMQGQLREELEKLGNRTEALFSERFEQQWFNIYNSFSLPSDQGFSTISRENVQQMIRQVWCADGKNWSKRVWGNTEKLLETLNEELVNSVVTGAPASNLKRALRERFNVSYNAADTIARTELAHIQTQAAATRYKNAGVKEIEVWADEDERRCEECGKLHEQRFPIGAKVPIPAHPRCRCCILPVIE